MIAVCTPCRERSARLEARRNALLDKLRRIQAVHAGLFADVLEAKTGRDLDHLDAEVHALVPGSNENN